MQYVIFIVIFYITILLLYNILFFMMDKKIARLFDEKKYFEVIGYIKKNKRFLQLSYYQYIAALAYFTIDDKSSFGKLKSVMVNYNSGQKLVFCITVNLLWVAVLYMQDYVEEADKLFDDEELRISLLSSRKQIFIEHVFDMAKLANSFYKEDYDSAEAVYRKEDNIMNDGMWAVMNYYMCEIYEKKGEHDKIRPITLEAEIRLAENPYKYLFKKWEHVK